MDEAPTGLPTAGIGGDAQRALWERVLSGPLEDVGRKDWNGLRKKSELFSLARPAAKTSKWRFVRIEQAQIVDMSAGLSLLPSAADATLRLSRDDAGDKARERSAAQGRDGCMLRGVC